MAGRPTFRGSLVAAVAAALLPLAAVGAIKLAVASVDDDLPPVAFSTIVVDRNGELLRPFPVDDGRWRLETAIGDVDPTYLAMLRAYEDRRFDHHRGVDPWALVRAAWSALRSRRAVSGGSTLTMQVARLVDGRSTGALEAKIAQIMQALALERAHDKAAILTHYLNRAPFGGNLEGVRTAALAYFGKEPLRLTAAEAALLVALPQSPEQRRLDRGPQHRARALAARNRVLDRALELGVIDGPRHARAVQELLPDGRADMPVYAAHLAERTVAVEPDRPRHGLTIDRGLQASLETLAAERARRFGDAVSVAVLVADHRTGEILASVGAADYLDQARDGFVDMTRAVRSPGSTLKPLIYGLAFQSGLAHPETLIEDRPTSFSGYRPVNFDGDHRGTVTVREALQLSLNVPAVRVLQKVGPSRLVAALERSGAEPVLADDKPPGLAIGLGGIGLTLSDLVSVYAMIANGGRSVALRSSPVSDSAEAGSAVLDPRAAWQVTSVLAGARDPGGITPGNYAFKTGTSYGHRDAWAVGFDGRHVVGVWVGRPDGRPLDRIGRAFAGVDVAAPVLEAAFARLGVAHRLPPPPPGVRSVTAASLPPQLRRFGVTAVVEEPGVTIAHPPHGARLESRFDKPLRVVVERGAGPFTVLLNGAPVLVDPWRRAFDLVLDGFGQQDIIVIAADGAAARASVFVEDLQ